MVSSGAASGSAASRCRRGRRLLVGGRKRVIEVGEVLDRGDPPFAESVEDDDRLLNDAVAPRHRSAHQRLGTTIPPPRSM